MTVKLGDMLYEPSTKRIGMVTDEIKDGWRTEWNDGEIEYLWNHTVAHYKSRWECLKADIANGYV